MRKTVVQLVAIIFPLALTLQPACRAQDVDVRARVVIVHPPGRKSAASPAEPAVVVWLKPLDSPAGFLPPEPGHFRMAQKNKMFEPHLLIIPLGSTVSFPNLDPFFHNVFSQFNGKRFDLGLYEAGSTRDVRFDHEGVSYLFCNIHPEMSAVIITMSTPWYVVSPGGPIVLPNVPPGQYEVHVWAEGADAQQLRALTHRLRISSDANNLGTISIPIEGPPPAHKNKFGEDYRPQSNSPY